MNDFTATSPIASPSQKGEQGHIGERGEAEGMREGQGGKNCGPYSRLYIIAELRENKRKREQRMKEWRGVGMGAQGHLAPLRNILIVEFSVRVAYPLEMCFVLLVDADLVIINYSTRPRTFSPS